MAKVHQPAGLIVSNVTDPARIKALRTGSLVKIGVTFAPAAATPEVRKQIGNVTAGGERFWVRLTTVAAKRLVGMVDNDLEYTKIHGLKADDLVAFEPRHILEIG